MIWSGESNPQHLTLQARAQPTELILAAGPVNLTFHVVGREFKKASAQDFEEMLIALHCIEISSLIMSSQLVQVWGMHGLLPG